MKVNLEEKLIKANKKLATPSELLNIVEYEKHAGIVDSEVLSRIGLNSELQSGKEIVKRISANKKSTEKFNQNRVFHISQIESVCKNYHLRFLNVRYFKGSIDNQLPEKLTNFEVAYNKRCTQDNMYIVAPASSFKLEKKQKDPLLFYRINKNYYYLIYKWGNDLNIFRRLFPIISNSWVSYIIISFLFTLPFLFIYLGFYILMICLSSVVVGIINFCSFDGNIRLVKKNEWNSRRL